MSEVKEAKPQSKPITKGDARCPGAASTQEIIAADKYRLDATFPADDIRQKRELERRIVLCYTDEPGNSGIDAFRLCDLFESRFPVPRSDISKIRDLSKYLLRIVALCKHIRVKPKTRDHLVLIFPCPRECGCF